MRTIVCRFRDEAHLNQHLIHGSNTFEPPVAMSFLGEFRAQANEKIRVVIVVEDLDQQCSVRLEVGPGLAHNTRPCWRYVGRIDGEDRIWLEMMLRKIRTLSRIMAA